LTIDTNNTNNTSVEWILKDNAAEALHIKQGSNCYIKFVTTNGAEQVVINDNGIGSMDFRIEGGAEDKLLLVDGGTDEVRMGDGDTNYVKSDSDGDISFTGTARIDWSKITANGATVTGCTTASSLSDIQTDNDGNVFTCSEVAATPNYLVVDFASVTAFNWVRILANYQGNAIHNLVVQLEVTPFDGSAWYTLESINHQPTSTATMEDHSFFVPSDAAFINSGVVNVRILHSATESNGHTWEFDEVSLYQ
jgi:hypothetical protein